MQTSKLAKRMLKYLPVLAVLIAAVIGLFIGKDLYPTLLVTSAKTPTQLSIEPNSLPPLIVLGGTGPCGFSNIYTSLPPKCKNFDGSFGPVPGTSPNFFVIPERK